jgi:hypothetical protein
MLEQRKKTDLLKIVRSISDMIHVAYVRQKEALGLGHAVLMARELVGNEPFAVLFADDVIDAKVPCLKQMVEVFDQTQCSVLATQIIEGKMISSYGVLDVKPVDSQLWRSPVRNQEHGGEAQARRSPVKPGHHRPLHSHPGEFSTASPTPPPAPAANCNSPTACACS